ncbi:MAG: efflux RND transporter permease subunit [Nitrospirae bacterium]|nr:efflux RND transporter permease subunit [Nitrospirota bacterium]
MRTVLKALTQNPLVMVFAVVVTCFTGIFAATHMPVDLFPDLDIPVVNIITHYPGASPEEMELLVTRPIEDMVRGVQGVKRVSSTSALGVSEVTVQFTWGTSVRDARQLVQAALSRLNGLLPQGVVPTMENIGTTLQEVTGYVVYGPQDTINIRDMVRYDIRSRLMSIDGVSGVQILGGDRRAFIVAAEPAVLAGVHLTVDDLVDTLRRRNSTIVAGYLTGTDREYFVTGDARFKDIDEIRSIMLETSDGQPIPITSVARLSEGKMPRHYIVHGDGRAAIAFIVRKQPGASAIKVADEVNREIRQLKSLFPPGTRIKKFYDQSEIISEARDGIYSGLILGALLAVLVLYFFLGHWRPTLIVASTIPLTFLAALGIMRLFGLGLNVITMSALTLAVGMIVDGAVVVSENIFRHRQMGKSALDASMDGAVEIAGPDASGVFTTVAAFLPLVLITGIAAVFLRPFGLTVSIALLVSLLMSLTVVPVLFSISEFSVPGEGFMGARFLGYFRDILARLLQFCLLHRKATIFTAFCSLGLLGLVFISGRPRMLPPIDEGAILIEYIMPPGTSLEESNRIGAMLDSIALSEEDVSCVYRRTGSPEEGYQIEGVNRGEIVIKLRPESQRSHSVTDVIQRLRKAYSQFQGVVFLYHQPTQEKIDESFSGLPALFGVTIYGTDTDRLISLADRIEGIMSAEPSISNIVNNTKIKAREIVVRLRYPELARYRVSTEQVFDTLESAFSGVEATDIIKQQERIGILVKLRGIDIHRPEDVRNIPLSTSTGEIIPLDRVADVRLIHTPSTITRLNGQREITLVAEVEGSIPHVVSRLREKFRQVKLPEGYSIEFTGQYRVLTKTVWELLMVVLTAVILIYLIMAMQFRSLFQPLMILTTIPLSLVGAVMALFLTRRGLDVSVGMGIVTLVGIAVNNAIILVDYANSELKRGKNVTDALFQASSVRLRPILMTALTTIFALIPIAIGTTTGSNIFQSFAITVIGGLLTGTLSTLVVVPVLISLKSPGN